jgi:hypothetical protein
MMQGQLKGLQELCRQAKEILTTLSGNQKTLSKDVSRGNSLTFYLNLITILKELESLQELCESAEKGDAASVQASSKKLAYASATLVRDARAEIRSGDNAIRKKDMIQGTTSIEYLVPQGFGLPYFFI